MKNEKIKNTPDESFRNMAYDVDIQSCSTMDCTGLIPALPLSDAEVENYNQLYKFMPGNVFPPEP